MDNQFLSKIQKLLVAEKTQLLNKNTFIDIDPDGDETDEVNANLISSIASQLSARDAIKIQHIDNALKKISNGIYGCCEECEEPISEKRLESNPHFILCISCAEQKEFEDRKKKIK